ncbi:MAG: hypothetical protein IJW76_04720 [Clostridia bacterium]|nr:hypothetical protein [Clostridia bacterium]
MKKIISLILITLLMFSFVSCKDNNEISEYKNDRYIYGMVPMPEGYATIMKFDIIEKTAVPACPDPLCDHGRSCPVSGITDFSATKNCIYIKRGDVSTGTRLYVYDLRTNKIELLMKGTQFSSVEVGPTNFVYFTMGEMEYNDAGEAVKENFHLYRRNEITGELKRLTTEPLAGFADLIDYNNDTFVWILRGKQGWQASDSNFQNIRPYEFPKEEFTFDSETIYTGGIRHELYRINNITGEKNLIFKDALSFRYCNVRPISGGTLHIPSINAGTEEKPHYISEHKIIYTDLYDTSITHTWEIPEDISVPNIYREGKNSKQLNDYHGFDCQQYEKDEKGNLYRLHGIFVVNPTTKEAFPIIYEGSRRLIRSAE